MNQIDTYRSESTNTLTKVRLCCDYELTIAVACLFRDVTKDYARY